MVVLRGSSQGDRVVIVVVSEHLACSRASIVTFVCITSAPSDSKLEGVNKRQSLARKLSILKLLRVLALPGGT